MGRVFRGIFGGGKVRVKAPPAPRQPGKLFSPTQVGQIGKRYGTETKAKWEQILANMGVGGEARESLGKGIETQAGALSKSLGALTEESGFGPITGDISGMTLSGENPLGNIIRALETELRGRGQISHALF